MRKLAIFCIALCAAAADPSRFATLDGVRIHYESYGSGKQAVVFIHGWSCDLTFWRRQAPVYEKRRSLLVDLPGHGASDKPEISYTMERFARAVDAVMRDAGVEKAVLVGHSMGGPVALTFLRLYPEKTAGLVIVDSYIPPPLKDEAERQKRVAEAAGFIRAMSAPESRASLERTVDWMFTPQTPAAVREQVLNNVLSAPQHVRASALQNLLASDPLAGIRSDVPAMAIMVKNAERHPEEYLRRAFPNLRIYQEWEGAGHFLMMELPERFNAALVEFLDRQ